MQYSLARFISFLAAGLLASASSASQGLKECPRRSSSQSALGSMGRWVRAPNSASVRHEQELVVGQLRLWTLVPLTGVLVSLTTLGTCVPSARTNECPVASLPTAAVPEAHGAQAVEVRAGGAAQEHLLGESQHVSEAPTSISIFLGWVGWWRRWRSAAGWLVGALFIGTSEGA